MFTSADITLLAQSIVSVQRLSKKIQKFQKQIFGLKRKIAFNNVLYVLLNFYKLIIVLYWWNST